MRPNIESKLNQVSRLNTSGTSQVSRGRLQRGEFEDFYRFKARSSSTLELGLTRLQRNANIEVYGLKRGFQKVRKRLGNQPFRALPSKRINRFLDRVGISRQRGRKEESITTSVEKGNTYLIRVFSKSRKGTKYRLSTGFEAAPTVDFPDVSSLQPTELTLPTTVEDSLSVGNTTDLYEFSLADRKQVSFNLSGLGANANLRLLDSERREISTSSNAGIVEDSIVRNLRSDVYFVEVSGAPTGYRLSAQVSDQTEYTEYSLYSGEGTIFSQGQLSGFQIPLPRAQVEAIAVDLNIPLDSIPPDFIAPRLVQEEQSSIGTTLNTALVDGDSSGFVGYVNHLIDPSDVEVLSLIPAPILDVGLLPINPEITLDSKKGYTLEFSMALDSVSVDDDEASGFNLVVIGDDGAGVELGWTPQEILSRASDFSEAERETLGFDPAKLTTYSLYVLDDNYSFYAGETELLSGPLRQYAFSPAAAEPIIPFNPYATSNYLFLGDNSDRGRSTFTIEQIDLYT